MIPVYVPQIIALAYIGTDILVLIRFFGLRSKLSEIRLNLILFTKFRQLAEFYAMGETSEFMARLASTPPSAITEESFTGSYGQLNREIEELHRQFALPYKLKERPREIGNAMKEIFVLALLLIITTAFASVTDFVLISLLFAILLNSVFYYPFISLYYESVSDVNEAFRIQASMKAKED